MLGQLANCPKCNSMILIAAPDSAAGDSSKKVEVDPGAGPSVDSMALTKEGISSPAIDAGDDEYRLAEMPSDAPLHGNDDWSRSFSEPDATTEQVSEWQPTQPLVPSEDWTSEGTTKTRQLLLIGTLAVAGIAFSIIGFLFFLQWYNNSDSTTVADGTGQVSAPETEPDGVEASGAEDAAGSDGDDLESPATDPSLGDASEQVDEPGGSGELGGGDAALIDPLSDPLASNDAGDSGSSGDTTDLPDASEGHSSEGDSSVGDSSEGGAEASVAAEEDGRPLPKKLQFFAPMLDVALQPVLNDIPVVPSEAPVTAEELGIESESMREPIPAVDWGTQSEVAVNGLIFQETPLFQMLNLLVHFTGVPASVDFDSLAASGVDRNKLVTLQVTNAIPIGEVIKKAEDAIGLALSPQENRLLRLQAVGDRLEDRLPSSIAIDDLWTTDESQQWLQNTLKTLYPDVIDGFTVDAGTLTVDRQVVGWREWFETLRMLEGLRIESGQPGKLEGFQRSAINPGFVTASASNSLKKIAADSVPKAKPVGQLLSGIARSADMQCWIDWPSIAELGVGPQTLAAVITHDRTMGQVLSDCVEQFGLVVAVLDQESVWVTTPTAYRKYARLSVLPRDGRTVDQWRQYLRPLTPLDDQGVGQLIVVPTPDDAFVIVRSCLPNLSF